ncbi:hypothetical protein FIV42_02045 [Persicimonas caeni]|uniref:Tetratricopeptide repeat protein n=1 Tax=Persicimonas caeni TaxID=2292766 RepID=A0A4Y6PMQ3_PERCE|nr:hypothetical protein [Persicimonas caeni]QDG49561.1 hypothetical protein FIV42_02045 [Persicimonas caeni]QED30782.1 hypothetical protein FRD00_02040 [Persicimonas caeni]
MNHSARRIGKVSTCGVIGIALMLAVSASASAQESGDDARPAHNEAPAAPSDAQLELNDRAVENIVEGNYARAVAQLEEAVLRGEFNILYLNLGRAYQKLGNCEKARAALTKAKDAPAVAEPAPHLVEKKADQYLAEIDASCAEETDALTTSDEPNGPRVPEEPSEPNTTNDVKSAPDTSAPTSTDVRGRRPNLLYLEVVGHGGASTFNYERFFHIDETFWGIEYDLGVGIGIGHSEGEFDFLVGDGTGQLTSLPVYATTTFFGGHHSLLVQLGVVAASFKAREDGVLTGTAGAITGFAQAGYQYQADGGFLLRATLTTAKFNKRVVLPGLSLGWSF